MSDSPNAFIKHTKEADPGGFKISRSSNKGAQRQARDGYNLRNVGAYIVTCLGVRHDRGSCPAMECITNLNVQSCILLSMTCLNLE